jgi:hypothetical protein
LRLALSKGPNRVGVSTHTRMETGPVSKTSCFLSPNLLESGRWTKFKNSLILCVIHHRQNRIETLNDFINVLMLLKFILQKLELNVPYNIMVLYIYIYINKYT